MRTKALLVGAIIGAASLASSMAQVYSVNIVGYVNMQIPVGFTIIHNPLKNGDNTVGAVIPAPPKAITLYKFNGTGFAINSYDVDFGWDDAAMSVAPGEAFFVLAPEALTLTFVGEVATGADSNMSLNSGLNMIGSKVPQEGLLTTQLMYTPSATGDTIYKWNGTGYSIFNYDPDFGWDPEPTIGVGEGFWAFRTAAGTWTRNFSVGP